MKKILGIFILLFTLSLNFSFADNSQNFLKVDQYENKVVKTANYSFDFKTNLFKVYDKTGKNLLMTVYKGNFDYPYEFFVSDKYVYYVRSKEGVGSSIVQINLETKKSKIIKNYKSMINIANVRGSDVYHISSYDEFNPKLQVLNLNTFKDKFIAEGVGDIQFGKSKIVYRNYRTDVSAKPLYIIGYDYKNSMLISKAVIDFTIIDGKIYFAETKLKKSPVDGEYYGDINNSSVYVCNEDGSNKKALTGNINGQIIKITPNEIEFMSENLSKYYKMDLKTKKTVEFKPSNK
ncbi:hypothetical protein HMPREF1142_1412 [Peptostreptococcaceae bacterium AS15]|nr:hypothetical protein HMPREF1142_1412 [Peptostreptococcaceae bacterium AS15]